MIKYLINILNQNNLRLGLIVVTTAILTVLIALSFRVIRYTDYAPAAIVDIDPSLAYENIQRNRNKIIFIDVRSEAEYNNAHASSSINLPIHYMYDDTHGLKNEKGIPLPKNTDVEIYLTCTGGRLAGVAYSYLEHYGYRNIKRIKGGLSAWSGAGLPMIVNDAFAKFNTAPLDRPYVHK